ncbi:DNA repair protein RAD50, putative [Plasmodium malariae]|uniref:DNA repair protein RAD50, putative n=1 Tax=Plasmodium malariae TaxID=5858 RepID=A0A1C3L010_PLAMA|nr:DNA repair protein RAD50, putative [Plasmodium malariae]
MTTFERIGIQGIRSYCDDVVEELEFSSPITIIYGNNGSGKSTIIECLKVSCTGDFPPNAEKGKSFVHDPLISNKMNIRGKIDLLLNNYNNKRIGISRCFNLFYSKDKNKKVKHTFRALDNNIILKKEKGEDIIITNKCVDINSHIPKLMGVSKALLENVILCHHEESLWPFSESIKIKKKFDELFGDDHFSKILEELIKCKKAANDILKKKEYELVRLKDCYEKKKNMNVEIEKNEKEIQNAKMSIQLDQEKINENTTIVENLNKKRTILYKLISDINTHYSECQFESSGKEKTNHIKNTKLNKVISLGIPKIQTNQQQCLENLEIDEEVKEQMKKRNNAFMNELDSKIKKKRKKTFDFSFQIDEHMLHLLNSIMNKYLDKYELKIVDIEREVQLLKERLILISKELHDINKMVKSYADILSEFHIMLEEKQVRSVNTMVTCFLCNKKDIKKIKQSISTLRHRDETLNNFFGMVESSKQCNMCTSTILDEQLTNVKLNVCREKEEIYKQIEESEKELTNLKRKKREIFPVVRFYHSHIEHIHREIISQNDDLKSVQKHMTDIQSKLDRCALKIYKINEKHTLIKELQKTCVHLISREKDIIYERDQLISFHVHMVEVFSSFQKMQNAEDKWSEAIYALLDSMEKEEVGEARGLNEEREVKETKTTVLKELKGFLNNFIELCNHKKSMVCIMERSNEYINNIYVLLGKHVADDNTGITEITGSNIGSSSCSSSSGRCYGYLKGRGISNHENMLREGKNTLEIRTMNTEKTELGKETVKSNEGVNVMTSLKLVKHESYVDNIKKEGINMIAGESNTNDIRITMNNCMTECKKEEEKIKPTQHLIQSYLVKGEIQNEEKNEMYEEEEKKNKQKKREENCGFSPDTHTCVHYLERIINNNKCFGKPHDKLYEKLYDKLMLFLNAEEAKKEQQLDVLHKMKCFSNDRKEYIKKKMHELESCIRTERKKRQVLNKMESYISYYLKKKTCVQNLINSTFLLIKKCDGKNKYIKRCIRSSKNSIFFENQNYYVKMNIMKELAENVLLTETEKEQEEKKLKKVKEQLYTNEIIKSESNELAKKINEKKEQILRLEAEKLNMEKMLHNILINTNLKKMHESFLSYQKSFISSLNELKNSFWYVQEGGQKEEEKEEELTEVHSIVNMLKQKFEMNRDIYTFINETFEFLIHKNKLFEIINREKEKIKEKIETYNKYITSLQVKEAEMNGKICLREEYIQKLKSDIKSKLFMNIEKEYKKKIIEIFVYKNKLIYQ